MSERWIVILLVFLWAVSWRLSAQAEREGRPRATALFLAFSATQLILFGWFVMGGGN